MSALLGSAAMGTDALTEGFAAKGVSMPLFGSDKSRPAATVKLDLLKMEADRRGFLRVAIFPLAVGRNVEIRFQTLDAKALADFAPAFRVLARTETIELHDCKIYAPGSEEPVLEARLIRIEGEDPWQIQEAALATGQHFPKASLAIHGKDAGLVSSKGDGPRQHIRLFPAK